MALFREHDSSVSSHRVSDAAAYESTHRSKQQTSHTPVLLLIIVLASLATLLCYRGFLGKYNQGLHNSVAEQLQLLLPDTTLQLGRVAADGPDKIIVNDIRIASKQSGDKRPILVIQRAVLQGDLDIANWLQKTTRVRQVDLHGVRIDAWPNPDQTWSIQALNPQSSSASETPRLLIHDANVRLFSDSSRQASVISIPDIHGHVTVVEKQHSVAIEGRPVRGQKPPLHFHLNCRGAGLLKSVQIDGLLDPNSQRWTAQGSVEQLLFSPKLLDALAPQLAQYFSQLQGLDCIASSNFKVSANAPSQVAFEVQGTIASGRLRDPRLPYPLDDLRSSFFCNNRMLQLRAMHATSGEAELDLSCDILGFGRDVPMVIHAQAHNLELDSRLRASLPLGLQEQWDNLQPTGRVNGNIELSYDGNYWTPIASIECQDVALEPWLFPYPITNVHGLVRYQHGTISSEQLQGRASGQPVFASFSLSRADSEWYGKLSGNSVGPIVVDEQLIAALTARNKETSSVETFVRSLRPRGSIELTKVSFERETPADPLWHRTLDLQVHGGSIHYDRFRYPIYDIRGRIAVQDDSWWLHRFEGHNDSARIHCSGNWRSTETNDLPFDLRFDATAVPMVEELRLALTSDAQAIWDELQPSGSIDQVQVHLSRRADEPLTTRVVIVEESESNVASGRSLRLQPKSFPLWLTEIDCHIEYTAGQVVIRNVSGVNGASRISMRGMCQPQADGRWLADVQWLPRTRLIVDGQLLRALPKSMRDSLVKLDFRGPVSVLGNSQILFSNEADTPIQTLWNCQLDVENGQLSDGKGIGALRGTVWTVGGSDGTSLNISGSIAMDSLNIHSLPMTRLRGPYAVHDNTLFFGTEVKQPTPLVQPGLSPEEQPLEMTADALTGKLTLAGQGRLDTGKFYLNADLKDAQLSTLLRDVGMDRASTRAQCNARLNFSGIPWNSQTWNGEGDIWLADAELFQLPFMMRLLSTASISADNDSAFQTAHIHFDIDGDRVPLQIKCEGDVLRLRGEGWTNLRREIDLELYSYIGRRPIYSIVSPLLAESRYATFMMIKVTGTLDNLHMQRQPFPQIEATLQQIFPEVAEQNRIQNLVPWR